MLCLHVVLIYSGTLYPLFVSKTYFASLTVILFLSATDKDLSYDHLASGLKAALQNDKSAFDADRLQKYTGN